MQCDLNPFVGVFSADVLTSVRWGLENAGGGRPVLWRGLSRMSDYTGI